ncbi:MAG: DnaJ family domain-containing protein [Thermodesulfovibrionales bacterium]
MDFLKRIAEQRIREAIERGEFDNLSNKGKPLDLEDDSLVPEDLRMAYRILKNTGYLPPELELKKEIVSLRDLINTIDDDEKRLKRLRELNFKLMKLSIMLKRPVNLDDYEERLFQKGLDENTAPSTKRGRGV